MPSHDNGKTGLLRRKKRGSQRRGDCATYMVPTILQAEIIKNKDRSDC